MVVIQEKLKEKEIAGIANTIRKINVPTTPIEEDRYFNERLPISPPKPSEK